MSHPDLDRLSRRERTRTPPAWFAAGVRLGRLEAVSLGHSCIYTGLLICAFVLGNPQPATTLLGFGHGVLWIAMSLVCLAAATYRVIPWWLAICVTVLGGIGPFFGTVGFLIESRRRTRVDRLGPARA